VFGYTLLTASWTRVIFLIALTLFLLFVHSHPSLAHADRFGDHTHPAVTHLLCTPDSMSTHTGSDDTLHFEGSENISRTAIDLYLFPERSSVQTTSKESNSAIVSSALSLLATTKSIALFQGCAPSLLSSPRGLTPDLRAPPHFSFA